jgi:hypothetical protein
LTVIWKHIAQHYRQHKSLGRRDQPARSLETKWDIIWHDVAKFVSVYNQVLQMRESRVLPDDMLEVMLQLYKVKHPKQIVICVHTLSVDLEGRAEVV